MSQLDSQSRHVRLTPAGVRDSQQVARRIPLDIPVIIEAPVLPHEIEDELAASIEAMGRLVSVPCAA